MTTKTKPAGARVAIRNNDLAQIHIAKKALHWSDEEYRSLLMTVCGVDSASKLDMAGRGRFLEHCRKCGWSPFPAKAGAKPRNKLSPLAAKVYSLWQQLYTAKLVRDRSYKALETWAKGQTGVDKLEWHNEAQLGQCIEQLKAWLLRKAP